jgi:hypothetical protein
VANRYQGGILGVGFNPLRAPNAPTIGTATSPSGTTASVAFTAPANVGGSAITSYAVQSTPDNIGATGASSPITVSGLTTGTAYTFRVTALNSYGPSPASAASNSVTPVAQGQQAYCTPGTYSWVAPAGVTSVSVVAVGSGGGGDTGNGIGAVGLLYGTSRSGAGGGLAYANNVSVTPGETLTVVVGAGGLGGSSYSYNRTTNSYNTIPTASTSGAESSFKRSSTNLVRATGGANLNGAPGSAATGTGGSGGSGNGSNACFAAGGGGGGGYAGNGGNGALGGNDNATAGAGGGGGGGGTNYYGNVGGGGGGGVGILGQGSNGAKGVFLGLGTNMGGGGGSSGSNGGSPSGGQGGGAGGAFGGGGGGGYLHQTCCFYIASAGGAGGGGAVRIIWPGTTRSFPSTNTGNL